MFNAQPWSLKSGSGLNASKSESLRGPGVGIKCVKVRFSSRGVGIKCVKVRVSSRWVGIKCVKVRVSTRWVGSKCLKVRVSMREVGITFSSDYCHNCVCPNYAFVSNYISYFRLFFKCKSIDKLFDRFITCLKLRINFTNLYIFTTCSCCNCATFIKDLHHQRPNLKNLSWGLNSNRSSNMFGST